MKRSDDRILTTHAGRLERPDALTDHMRADPNGRPTDSRFTELLYKSVETVVRSQAKAGIDVVNDGEFGKLSWHSYLFGRMSGFERKNIPTDSIPGRRNTSKDRAAFQQFYAEMDKEGRYHKDPEGGPRTEGTWVCTGPIEYVGQTAIAEDAANLCSACDLFGIGEAFLPSTAPQQLVPNFFYPDEDAYLEAIALAMRSEYRAIVDSGLIVQLDDPMLPFEWEQLPPGSGIAEYRSLAAKHVELVNFALQGIPEDRVRYHICWGSWHGPHAHDLPIENVIDLLFRVNAQGYVFEAANPRHEHEWAVWKEVALPEEKIIVPGVISHATNTVEHPQLVAWRIGLYANAVGKERVIAGTDCGLGYRVHDQIAQAKLEALAQGAKLASRELWSRR